jgi:uncharacterized repeat protein (TIGR03806 family)
MARMVVCVVLALTAGGAQSLWAEASHEPYGLGERVLPRAYLGMPETASGKIPERLSQTGVFRNLVSLTPTPGLIPYELVVPFWSDGAHKQRFVAIPKGRILFAAKGEWRFPAGTVFVKTFDLPVDEANSTVTRRLETRLLVRDRMGGVYGVVYKWRPDGSDADLLHDSVTEPIPIRTAGGEIRQQTWYYPSREDCLKCHNNAAGGVLGLKTRQMNRDLTYPGGVTDNQLRAWNHIGFFTPALDEVAIAGLDRLAPTGDGSRSLEDRARSYLDANCAQCHRPGGVVANFDARYDTPLPAQQLVNGPVLFNQGIDRAHVITPHDVWRSVALMRVNTNEEIRMPPVARQTIDGSGVALLSEWIRSLPGKDVLEPPQITPQGGSFDRPVTVTLKEGVPGAEIHYTLDGSNPDNTDPLYKEPIRITGPTVLRARAYKDGLTRSIPAQQTFIVAK